MINYNKASGTSNQTIYLTVYRETYYSLPVDVSEECVVPEIDELPKEEVVDVPSVCVHKIEATLDQLKAHVT